MKKTISFSLLILLSLHVYSQKSITADSIGKILTIHFEMYQPEMYKYSSLKAYSEQPPFLSEEQILKERELYKLILSSDYNTSTSYIFEFCHNLLIHTPNLGYECLKHLNQPTDDDQIIESLFMQMLFAEEFGEQLAVNNLFSDRLNWKKRWSDYLSIYAIYESSIPQIEKSIKQTGNLDLAGNLLDALINIGSPKAIPMVKQVIETAVEDELQAKALTTYKLLAGFDGIKYLHNVKPVGPLSGEEKKLCIQSLNNETSLENKYGINMLNDFIFMNKYGHVQAPSIVWIDKQGLTQNVKENKPIKLTPEQKAELFDALIASKGFGFEAVKGTLFQNINKTDINILIQIRKEGFYSPNKLSAGRVKAINTLVGVLRKQ
jgi:hypothetical protein